DAEDSGGDGAVAHQSRPRNPQAKDATSATQGRPMSCKRARNLFGRYWDDEVTQAEREWLESHFTGCVTCRAEYDSLAPAPELVGSAPPRQAPGAFVERTVARRRRARAPPPRG